MCTLCEFFFFIPTRTKRDAFRFLVKGHLILQVVALVGVLAFSRVYLIVFRLVVYCSEENPPLCERTGPVR